MKSVWGAHVRTPEEDVRSEECVCETPRACLCCHRPPEMVEQDLLYAYQGLIDTIKGEEPVEDQLPASITQGASNLHSDKDMEDKIKVLDPRVQKLIRTYLEVFGELPPPGLMRQAGTDGPQAEARVRGSRDPEETLSCS